MDSYTIENAGRAGKELVMADKFNPSVMPDTYGGKQGGFLQSTFGHPDLRFNKIGTLTEPQQLAQLANLGITSGRNLFGWNAPDIESQRQAEYRNLRQNVIPQLAQHYGAGAGGRGAFEQNLANAQGGIQERLAALQNQRQFELQKLRQEQIPRMAELGQQPSFVGHITEGAFNPQAAPERLLADRLTGSRPVQRAEALVSNVGQGIHEFLSKPPRTPEEIAKADVRLPNGAPMSQKMKAQLAKLPPAALDKVRQAYQMLEQASRPGGAGAGKGPIVPLKPQQERKVNQLVQKYRIPEHVAPWIQEKHIPMLESLAKRRRGSQELAQIESVDQIETAYDYWKQHPSKRAKIADWFRSIVGKKPKRK